MLPSESIALLDKAAIAIGRHEGRLADLAERLDNVELAVRRMEALHLNSRLEALERKGRAKEAGQEAEARLDKTANEAMRLAYVSRLQGRREAAVECLAILDNNIGYKDVVHKIRERFGL